MATRKTSESQIRLPETKSSLSEQAFNRLEEMIVTLRLPPGSLWSEATLSENHRLPIERKAEA